MAALQAEHDHASSEEDRARLAERLNEELKRLFAGLTPWQRVLLARHPLRPRMLDYVEAVFDDFIEFHGDRAIGDDPAMVGGIARFRGRTVVLVGQQKGISTDEKVRRNFGMAHPEGYRKALRLFELAERMSLPVVTMVDTPAAHPGIEAEQRGQGPAISRNLWALSKLRTPVFAAVLGEGGSGGALGIAVGDWIAMFEHAIYVICPPERCAEILWRDADRKELAASALKITAKDLKGLGVIDAILQEPLGGAHRDPAAAAQSFAAELERFLDKAEEGFWTLDKRQAKFRAMGKWREVG
ncbi:MAG: acetyl-CoA carboxylase carboxyltransferase subunit alpha [bacterium]|nr:acetyl-CoA carboxylase carboxyltransferase subunit alpha [bacterium]